jgi:isoleucyl-tRNA synthetase
MFRPFPPSPNFSALEPGILWFWKDRRIFERSHYRRAGAPKFAVQAAHPLNRAVEDLFLRHQLMRGFSYERRGTWPDALWADFLPSSLREEPLKMDGRDPLSLADARVCYGADVLRWHFYRSVPPSEFNERAIRNSARALRKLCSVLSFFVARANQAGFEPADRVLGAVEQLSHAELVGWSGCNAFCERPEFDQWILLELADLTLNARYWLGAYDCYSAARAIEEFIDLVSQYARHCRKRFAADHDAFWTLYECLIQTTKIIAPFVPFLAETMWQALAVAPFSGRVAESVHLCDYPLPVRDGVDVSRLLARMEIVRAIVAMGRSARHSAKLRWRQPLSRALITLTDDPRLDWVKSHRAWLAEELNVKQVEFPANISFAVSYRLEPDLPRLGPRLRKRLPALAAALAAADPLEILARLEGSGATTILLQDGPVEITGDDVRLQLDTKPGWCAGFDGIGVVLLATELTNDLLAEGLARDLIHVINSVRRELNCDLSEKVAVEIAVDLRLWLDLEPFKAMIQTETLSEIAWVDASQSGSMLHASTPLSRQFDLGGSIARIWVSPQGAAASPCLPQVLEKLPTEAAMQPNGESGTDGYQEASGS